ncbi:MAG: hypothetical protein M1820_008033, partial [Bogoriella megaspora]
MNWNKEYILLSNSVVDDGGATTMAFDSENEPSKGGASLRTSWMSWVCVYIWISHICFAIILLGLAKYPKIEGLRGRHLPRQPS